METQLIEVHTPAESAALDVIFIHGLDGDPRGSWTGKAAGTFWPQWLGEDAPVAVWSLGYSAWSSKWRGSAMRLPERGVNLLAYLEAFGIGTRPICFVCHSLGGLVAKQLLFHSYLNPGEEHLVAQATRGVVFLGTPHTGSGLATAVSALRTIYRPTGAVRDLEDNDAYLRQLNDWYRGFAPRAGLRHLVMYETQKLKGLLVVDAAAANPGLPGVTAVPVDADHVSMCKPGGRKSLVYLSTLRFVQQLTAADGNGTGVDETTGAEHDAAPAPGRSDRRGERAPVVRTGTGGPRLREAAQLCVQNLVDLQFPWGEWSDRRTEMETVIAERHPGAYAAVPKPNMARTLFALEALEGLPGRQTAEMRERALRWMTGQIVDGWFREWAEGQTPHSETRSTELILRPDVRHTAQVVTALCRWQQDRDPLARLVRNVAGEILPDGFWPNNVGGRRPRLLATVYAVEALTRITYAGFRLPLTDMLDRVDAAMARRALTQGISALLVDGQAGQGLLGSENSRSPYITGLALFRIGQLAGRHPDLRELTDMMIDGLASALGPHGWEDTSVPPSLRPKTRSRTTLRCVAGLTRAAESGAGVPESLLATCEQLATDILLADTGPNLDSPDYACGLISLVSSHPELGEADLWPDEDAHFVERRAVRTQAWREEMEQVVHRIRGMAELDLPGYREALDAYEPRLGYL